MADAVNTEAPLPVAMKVTEKFPSGGPCVGRLNELALRILTRGQRGKSSKKQSYIMKQTT